MKTPEEIKKNARTCISQPATESCYSCPLHSECHGLVEYVIKDLLDLVLMYESHLEQVERERYAAIADLKLYAGCKVCKHGDFKFPKECMDCGDETNYWQWRGVCPENTKEEN